MLRGAVEIEERPGVGWPDATRRDLPRHAAAERLVRELPDRIAVDVEDLERFVDVIRQQEASDWIDRLRGIDLIDARLCGRRRGRIRIDEAEEHSRWRRDPRAQQQRVRRVGHVVARGYGDLIDRQI